MLADAQRGVVERGLDENAGRVRVTFRYRARTWTVVVEADRGLNETAPQGRLRRAVAGKPR